MHSFSMRLALFAAMVMPAVARAGGFAEPVIEPQVFPPPVSSSVTALPPEAYQRPGWTTQEYNGLPLEEHSAARPVHVVSEPGNSYAVNGLPGVPNTSLSGTLIAFGDLKPATLLYGFNSDNPAGLPIFARMSDVNARGRPTVFDGATLRGEVKYSDQNASIVFDTARLKSGKEIKIQAIAVSGHSGNTGVAERVNRHTLQRYGSLFLAGLIQGVGQVGMARLQEQSQAQTYVVTGDGNTITVKPNSATDAEIAAAALEPVGSAMASAVQRGFNRPHTISAKAGMPFAVVFVESVTAADLKKAGATVGSATQGATK